MRLVRDLPRKVVQGRLECVGAQCLADSRVCGSKDLLVVGMIDYKSVYRIVRIMVVRSAGISLQPLSDALWRTSTLKICQKRFEDCLNHFSLRYEGRQLQVSVDRPTVSLLRA